MTSHLMKPKAIERCQLIASLTTELLQEQNAVELMRAMAWTRMMLHVAAATGMSFTLHDL